MQWQVAVPILIVLTSFIKSLEMPHMSIVWHIITQNQVASPWEWEWECPPHPHPFPPPLDCSGCDDASSSSSSASKILRASLPKSRRPALFTVNNFSFAALSITMRHGRGTHFMLGRCEWQRRKNTRARPFYPLVYSAGENCCWCPICTTNESRKVAWIVFITTRCFFF